MRECCRRAAGLADEPSRARVALGAAAVGGVATRRVRRVRRVRGWAREAVSAGGASAAAGERRRRRRLTAARSRVAPADSVRRRRRRRRVAFARGGGGGCAFGCPRHALRRVHGEREAHPGDGDGVRLGVRQPGQRVGARARRRRRRPRRRVRPESALARVRDRDGHRDRRAFGGRRFGERRDGKRVPDDRARGVRRGRRRRERARRGVGANARSVCVASRNLPSASWSPGRSPRRASSATPRTCSTTPCPGSKCCVARPCTPA